METAHNPKMASGYLGIDEVCRLLGVHYNTVRRWYQQGTLPKPIPGQKGKRFWSESEIKQWQGRN